MNDTPRTDAASHNMGSVAEPHYVVDIDLARDLERELAKAVAAERERCAKVCDEISNNMYWLNDRKEIVEDCAAAIRKGE